MNITKKQIIKELEKQHRLGYNLRNDWQTPRLKKIRVCLKLIEEIDFIGNRIY